MFWQNWKFGTLILVLEEICLLWYNQHYHSFHILFEFWKSTTLITLKTALFWILSTNSIIHSKTPVPLVITLHCDFMVTGQWWSVSPLLTFGRTVITLPLATHSPCCRQLIMLTTLSLSGHHVVSLQRSEWWNRSFAVQNYQIISPCEVQY